MIVNNYQIAWAGSASLAESPTWDNESQNLYWIDIAEKKLNILNLKLKENREYQMPGLIGSVVNRQSGGVLATVDQSLVAMDLQTGQIENMAKLIPAGRNDLRVNDGKCDCMGRFWIGVATEDNNKRGMLYRLDTDGSVEEVENDIIFSNGMGWSPDHTKFYYVDSARHCIFQYHFDALTGKISARGIFIQFNIEADFKPDGLTVDAAGFVWVACFNGWKILRYSPAGKLDKEYKLPVKRPTSCMFGGKNLATLFVTSCSRDVNEIHKLAPPAGSIFTINTGVVGLAEYSYAG